MANEITVLEIDGRRAQLLFLFPIPAPAQVGGVNIVPTPATGPAGEDLLPGHATKILATAEKNDLDAGTLAFEVIGFVIGSGLTGQQLLARARAIYASRKAEFDSDYADRYSRLGQRFNAV